MGIENRRFQRAYGPPLDSQTVKGTTAVSQKLVAIHWIDARDAPAVIFFLQDTDPPAKRALCPDPTVAMR